MGCCSLHLLAHSRRLSDIENGTVSMDELTTIACRQAMETGAGRSALWASSPRLYVTASTAHSVVLRARIGSCPWALPSLAGSALAATGILPARKLWRISQCIMDGLDVHRKRNRGLLFSTNQARQSSACESLHHGLPSKRWLLNICTATISLRYRKKDEGDRGTCRDL